MEENQVRNLRKEKVGVVVSDKMGVIPATKGIQLGLWKHVR